jgi:murein DD-endopeptidase MepM/ murein hydrolase activator NlpD
MNSLASANRAKICLEQICPRQISLEQIIPAQICSTSKILPKKRSLLLILGLLGALQPPAASAQPVGAWHAGVFPVSEFLSYTSHYGSRIGPGGNAEWHHGLDIAAPLGTTIRSWWTGVVQDVINDESCGVGLVIRSGAYEHVYCHLAGRVEAGSLRSGPVTLVPGQWLRAGQPIGQVGLSGRTTGPHLHWGLRYQGSWLDPARILRAMAESRQALAESQRALAESQRALAESQRASAASQRRRQESAAAPKGPYGPSVASFR